MQYLNEENSGAMRITAVKFCRKCGAATPPDSPQQSCGACLLETGLSSDEPVAGVGLSAVASAKSDGSGGPIPMLMDFGDYELLQQIGRGGQGVVFRARQKSLNRTVALKVISLGQWASEAHVKRFRREAEAAARLEHPCIVPIYEVGERDGSCYFSMKFVEGGQLDEVAKREPMPPRRAAELIAKVARTVHYAHEHGILHRDIKPGNILLDAEGEPHLTDFGLARLVETESTVTRTLEVLGTPSYMAPEQARSNSPQGAAVSSGAVASAKAASPPNDAGLMRVIDVYGLGAVFYQLLTGQPPFAGGTTYETIKLLLDTEPRQPRLLNPKIDRDLSTICLKCLEKDPKRRYSSALALAEDLERWVKHEPIQARRTGIFTRGRKWVRRKPAVAALIASLVALAAAIGWNVWKGALISPPSALATNGIAVLPFENLSGNPDNAYLAEGIQDEILTLLAKVADLKVISRTSTQRYQNKPRNLAEIAKQLAVANILEGSVQKAADQVRVNVQLINAQTDSHLWAETYDRKLTDIFSAESEIAKGIAESLQAKLTGRDEQALAAKPTNNPEAYDAYLRGLAFEARYNSSHALDLLWKATDSYEQAVQLDPKFAVAWARLSRANASIYSDRYDATTEARGEGAKHALENAQKLQPNSAETQLALGYYQFWALSDYGAAKVTFGRVSNMLPSNSDVPWALGRVTRREGHFDQSVAYFEQALALDPRNVELLMDAAFTYVTLRQFPAALKLKDRVLDIMPNDLDVMASKANIHQAQGNLEDAAKFLSEIDEQTANEDSFEIKINQLRLERNYGEAVRLLQARLAQFHFAAEPERGNAWVQLALIQYLAGDTAGAKVSAEQARNIFEPLYRDQPDNEPPLVSLSQAYAMMGKKDAAVKAAERATVLKRNNRDQTFRVPLEENLASIQTVAGENSRAISTITQLLKTPYYSFNYITPITPALLRLDPIWDPLRADPAFQKLCEEKQH